MVDILIGLALGLVTATIIAEGRVRRANRRATAARDAMMDMFEKTQKMMDELGLEEVLRATAIMLADE